MTSGYVIGALTFGRVLVGRVEQLASIVPMGSAIVLAIAQPIVGYATAAPGALEQLAARVTL